MEDASALLRETESKLRGMVSVAASSGDYASVVRIASWAQALAGLVNGHHGAKLTPPTGNSSFEKHNKVTKQLSASDAATISSRRPTRSYPQFSKHDDEIIRLAWSKGKRKEYRHKAPYAVLEALAKAMAEQGAEGRVFSTDDFLPLPDKGSDDAVPNYQAYVGISLLKHKGLIDQHGRQGYSIPRLADFKDAVEAVWKKLPER
ncbi:MAG: hypothetical protein ACRD4X_01915 [Candidatus Acidiferrales bacterium]